MKQAPATGSSRRALLRLGVSTGILALLFVFLPLDELWAAIRQVSLRFWLLMLAGFLTTHIVGLIKWRVMLRAADAPLPPLGAAHCYFGGLFGSVFLPSVVGGDAVRLALAWRQTTNRAGVVLGSLFDRFLDVLALLALAGLSSLLLPRVEAPPVQRFFDLLSSPTAWVLLGVGLVVAGLFCWWLARRLRAQWVQLLDAAATLSQRRARVLLAFLLSLTTQFCLVLLTSAIAAVCGLHLPLVVWLFAFPLAKISALLPVTQAGIGVREVALAALLAPFGVGAPVAVAIGLVWETIILSGGLVGGLLMVLFGRHKAASTAPPALWEVERPTGDAGVVKH